MRQTNQNCFICIYVYIWKMHVQIRIYTHVSCINPDLQREYIYYVYICIYIYIHVCLFINQVFFAVFFVYITKLVYIYIYIGKPIFEKPKSFKTIIYIYIYKWKQLILWIYTQIQSVLFKFEWRDYISMGLTKQAYKPDYY